MKRLLMVSIIFAVLIIGSVCSFAEEGERDVWDGTTVKPTVIIEKDGIRYYAISSCEELAYIAEEGDA